MHVFIPSPQPAANPPEGARFLALRSKPLIVGAPREDVMGYDGPGGCHLVVPGYDKPDTFVVDLTGLRNETDIVEVLAYGFNELGWRELARRRRATSPAI